MRETETEARKRQQREERVNPVSGFIDAVGDLLVYAMEKRYRKESVTASVCQVTLRTPQVACWLCPPSPRIAFPAPSIF